MAARFWSGSGWVASVGVALGMLLAEGAAVAQTSGATQQAAQQNEAVRLIFQRFDTNKDGNISSVEFEKVGQQDFVAFDANKDGVVSKDEYLDPKPHNVGKIGADQLAEAKGIWSRQFDFLDADKDGRMTKSEHEAAGVKSFQRIDSNKDGKVTLAELQSATAK